jgi:hypothetical protein
MKAAQFPPTSAKIPGSADMSSSVVFRLECREELGLICTPLIIPAVKSFVEDIGNSVSTTGIIFINKLRLHCLQLLSPELSLDAIVESYLSDLSNSEKSKQITALEVAISSVHLRVLHNIPMKEKDISFMLPLAFEEPGYRQHGLVSVVDIVAHNCHLLWISTIRPSGSGQSSELTASASFQNLSLGLEIVSGQQTGRQDTNLGTNVFRCNLGPSQIGFGRDRLGITCDSFVVELGHACPEFLAVTIISIAREQCELLKIFKASALGLRLSKGHMIHSILKSSSSKAIVDPFSTIQPSYLVQCGRPHQFRTDSTFKFLFHLRDCLWHMEDSERRKFFSSGVPVGSMIEDDAMALLESRLAGLELDLSKITDIALLGISFSSLPTLRGRQQPTSSGRSRRSISMHLNNLELLVRDPLNGSSTELILAEIIVTGCLNNLELNPSVSQNAHSQTSLRERGRPRVQ